MKLTITPHAINKDLDPRLLTDKMVRHKVNLRSGTSDSDNVGVNENIKTNLKIENKHFIPGKPQYFLDLESSPVWAGLPTGEGYYHEGDVVTIETTDESGFVFTGWYENGVLQTSAKTFQLQVMSNRLLNAVYKINIQTEVSPEGLGEAFGAGLYDYGSNVVLTATPGDGNEFVNWTVGGVEVSTDLQYSFIAEIGLTVVANFIQSFIPNPDSGNLYNWMAITDARGLAPTGFVVASEEEWADLLAYLGGGAVAGGKMKAIAGFDAPNTGATDEVGFNGISTGARNPDGSFINFGTHSYHWIKNINN